GAPDGSFLDADDRVPGASLGFVDGDAVTEADVGGDELGGNGDEALVDHEGEAAGGAAAAGDQAGLAVHDVDLVVVADDDDLVAAAELLRLAVLPDAGELLAVRVEVLLEELVEVGADLVGAGQHLPLEHREGGVAVGGSA